MLFPAGARAKDCSLSTWACRVCAGTRFRWRRRCPDTRAIDLAIGPAGAPILRSPSAVNMGNPHAIFWVDDVEGYDLGQIGPVVEHHPLFPQRANVTLAAVPARDHIVIRTWERGAGLTQGLRFGGLRRRRRRRAACTHRPRGHGHPARRRPGDRVARSGRPCADDRPGRATSTTAASMPRAG